jgi:hypothetical protein
MDAHSAPRKMGPFLVWCCLASGCTLVGEAVLSDKPDGVEATGAANTASGGDSGGTTGQGGSATTASAGGAGGGGAPSSGAGGSGPVPLALTLDCPSPASPGAAASCALRLSARAGLGVAGEAEHLTCVAIPGPVTLFADDFEEGSLAPAWTTLQGSPETASLEGGEAAFADEDDWDAAVTLAVTGLSQVCVDFDVAQGNANNQERIRWEVSFDGGAGSTLFDLDFKSWKAAGTLVGFNRNACAIVPAGSAAATLRLRMESDDRPIWVDNVIVVGVAAPFVALVDEPFADLQAWTVVGGVAPFTTDFSGSSALFAEAQSFVATRAALDVTSCDVVDTDFSFGFEGSPDAGDSIELEISSDGGPFLPLETLDLGGAWDAKDTPLAWLGLRRTVGSGASSLQYRFTLSSDDAMEGVAVDDFEVGCANLPEPALAPVVDALGGDYQLSLTSTIPASVRVVCTWSRPGAGSFVAEDVVVYAPL